MIKKLGDAGVKCATFGAGAIDHLQRVENVGGFRVRTLEKTYNGLSHTFSLMNKGDFRSKFGIHQDPVRICRVFSGFVGDREPSCTFAIQKEVWVSDSSIAEDASSPIYCRRQRHRGYHGSAPETKVNAVA